MFFVVVPLCGFLLLKRILCGAWAEMCECVFLCKGGGLVFWYKKVDYSLEMWLILGWSPLLLRLSFFLLVSSCLISVCRGSLHNIPNSHTHMKPKKRKNCYKNFCIFKWKSWEKEKYLDGQAVDTVNFYFGEIPIFWTLVFSWDFGYLPVLSLCAHKGFFLTQSHAASCYLLSITVHLNKWDCRFWCGIKK